VRQPVPRTHSVARSAGAAADTAPAQQCSPKCSRTLPVAAATSSSTVRADRGELHEPRLPPLRERALVEPHPAPPSRRSATSALGRAPPDGPPARSNSDVAAAVAAIGRAITDLGPR
jgi:hypothetical protein